MKITFTSVYNIVRRKCSFSSLQNAICTYDVHISHILIVYVALSISFSLARSFSTFSPGTNACKYILECCIGVLNASLVALFVLFTIQQQHSSVLFFFFLHFISCLSSSHFASKIQKMLERHKAKENAVIVLCCTINRQRGPPSIDRWFGTCAGVTVCVCVD